MKVGTLMIIYIIVVHYCEVVQFLQMGKVVWVGFYKRLKTRKCLNLGFLILNIVLS